MLSQIVMVKIKEGTIKEQIDALMKGFAEMVRDIDGMSGQCGLALGIIQVEPYDFGAITHYGSRAAFDEYLKHPAHKKFGQTYMLPVVEKLEAVQFEH